MTAHTIRLREPWDRGVCENGSPRLTRKFNTPTGLDANSRVFLALGNPTNFEAVWLNGRRLEFSENASMVPRCEITDIIQPKNEVCLVVKVEPLPASGLEPLMRLEIEEDR